jgi:hypothetical protein
MQRGRRGRRGEEERKKRMRERGEYRIRGGGEGERKRNIGI